MSGQLSHTIDEQDELINSQEGDSDWQIALKFSIPLYQGGAVRSRIDQSTFELHQLELQQRATRDRVEQNIWFNLHAAQASFPSIELAQEAAEAARKNLDLVQDNYNKGSVSIIELLDARDASLNADQASTDAVYNFLIDLMNLQRATAEFDFFLSPEQLDSAVRRIRDYISSQ